MNEYVTMPDGSRARLVEGYSMNEYTNIFNVVVDLLKKNESIEALETLLSQEHKLPFFVHDLMRAKFYATHDDYEAALPFIEAALERLESKDISPAKIVPQEHWIMSDVYGIAGEIFANCNKPNKAKRAYEDYQLVLCRIRSDESYEEHVLSFRNYTVFSLQDLINETITVCSPTEMNDPYDTLLLKWGEVVRSNKSAKRHTTFLCDSFNSYRIRSFCKSKDENGIPTISNVLMWSHYADEHKGFCVEYQFSKEFFVTEDRRTIRFKDIKYHKRDEPLNLNTNTINTDAALCAKLDDWAYENEARLITYLPDEEGKFVSLPLGKAGHIYAIYFGYLCPDIRIQTIRSILSNHPEIKYFKMSSNPEDLFNLVANPL